MSKAYHDLDQILSSTVKGLIASQQKLDTLGQKSLLVWEEEGIPPKVWTWAECRLGLPVTFAPQPKTQMGQKTRLQVAPSQKSLGSLTVTLRYLEKPQDEEDWDYAGEYI